MKTILTGLLGTFLISPALPAATNLTHQTSTTATNETIDLGAGGKMDFVLIRPGSFVMGLWQNSSAEYTDEPAFKVTLTKPFYLGKYEVTQKQWSAIMDYNRSKFEGADLPMEDVSWDEVQSFLAKLQEKTGRKFALPTEAQWEYACRAGSTTHYCFTNSGETLGDYAWFSGNSDGVTHPVGGKKPNAWGLYDMHGNVWEWCADWYGRFPASGAAVDPQGPTSGTYRVIRGGGWTNGARTLRSSNRDSDWHGFKYVGLRCVMLVDEAAH